MYFRYQGARTILDVQTKMDQIQQEALLFLKNFHYEDLRFVLNFLKMAILLLLVI